MTKNEGEDSCVIMSPRNGTQIGLRRGPYFSQPELMQDLES